jgi:hypothetical protein
MADVVSGWDLAECGRDLSNSGWDLSNCGWYLDKCVCYIAEFGWNLAACAWALAERGWYLFNCGWDLAKCGWLRSSRGVWVSDANANAKAKVATILAASSDTVESEGRQVNQCWIQYFETFLSKPLRKINVRSYGAEYFHGANNIGKWRKGPIASEVNKEPTNYVCTCQILYALMVRHGIGIGIPPHWRLFESDVCCRWNPRDQSRHRSTPSPGSDMTLWVCLLRCLYFKKMNYNRKIK